MNKKQKILIEETKAYLVILESYRKTEKYTHKKQVKTSTAFKPLLESNLEIAEVFCLEYHEFIGIVYRRIKTISQEKITAKFIVYTENKNDYILEKKKD